MYWPLFACQKRNLVLWGGAGSGKSVFAADLIIFRLMVEERHYAAVFRKVARTVKVSVFPQLIASIERLGAKELWDVNRSTYSFRYRPNGNSIDCFGLDNVEKVKSITDERGVNPTIVWMEEATEMTPRDLEQINLRMRGMSRMRKQILVSFNPVSQMHWLKHHFFDTPQLGRTRTLNTTYRHNRFLDPDYRRELDALCERDPLYAQVYVRGEWGAIGNVVYGSFIMDPWPERITNGYADEVIYGLDFGYIHPSALIRVDLRELKLVEVGEHYYYEGDAYATECIYETHLTNADLIKRMKDLDISHSAPIYADCAEPKSIEELARAGYNVYPCDKGKDSVLDGIKLVKSIRVHSNEWNVNLNRESSMYHWREDKNGKQMDEPVPEDDHALDALRYALFTHLRPSNEQEGIVIRDLVAEAPPIIANLGLL